MNETKTLQIGDKAPLFSLENQKGEVVDLNNVLQNNKYALLVFYPADKTPGCTTQLCGIRDVYKEYSDLGVKVLGMNHGTAASHQKFIDAYGYQFDILVDEGKKVITEYGQLKTFFGNPMAVKRGVYLIDSTGTIVYIKQGQQKNTEIMQFIKDRESK